MTTNPEAAIQWLTENRESIESMMLANAIRGAMLNDEGKFDATSASLTVDELVKLAQYDADGLVVDTVHDLRDAVDRYCEDEGHAAEGWVLAIERWRKEPVIEASADLGTAQGIGILALADTMIRQYGL